MVLPITQLNIYATVNAFITPATTAITTTNYGHISTWDTSGVTNMSSLFLNKTTFSSDISGWNVSNVTNMSSMFSGATIFNNDISKWSTGNVTNMSYMLLGASSFNQPLHNWDVSKVTDMGVMFKNATNFNGNLSLWNTNRVTNMAQMFYNATSFNQDINYNSATNAWDVSGVTNMSGMFQGATIFNGDISLWNTKSVTNMGSMFSVATKFNCDITGWRVDNVKDMNSMFRAATSFNKDINYNSANGAWDVSGVTTMASMFNCMLGWGTYGVFNGNISLWNTKNVTSMNSMFSGTAKFNQDITCWKVDKVLDMQGMFNYAGSFNQDINYNSTNGAWDVSGVTNMGGMFNSATAFHGNISLWNTKSNTSLQYSPFYYGGMFQGTSYNGDISRWDTRNVTNMNYVFRENSKFNGDISGWNTSKVTSMRDMFRYAIMFNRDINYNSVTNAWDVQNVTDMAGMFYNASSFNGNISLWNTRGATTMGYLNYGGFTTGGMFHNATNFNCDISAWNTSNVNNMSFMFHNATSFNRNISNWDTRSVNNMGAMFNLATAFNQDLSWNTTNVTDMTEIFKYATNFNGNLSNLNITNVTNMTNMFQNASNFNNNSISNWNTTKLTNISGIFSGASKFNQDLSLWNTTNVTNMNSVFSFASSFNGNISGWNTRKVTNMGGMFNNATAFNQDLNSLDVSGVTNMTSMFFSANKFNGNISLWNTKRVTTMNTMFQGASIFNRDITGWCVDNVKDMTSMFYNATAFNQDLNSWDVSGVTNMTLTFGGATNFNGNISLWNTKSVTNMYGMFFAAINFNSNISSWNTNSLTSTYVMFHNAAAFNQDLNNWNVSGVTSMVQMFRGASSFNGNIASWDVRNVQANQMNAMFLSSAFNRDISIWEPVQNTAASNPNFATVLNSSYYPHWGKYRLNVNGLRFLTIFRNATYTDRGVSDLYTPLVTTGSVNSAIVGTYSVEYSATTAVTGRSYPSYAIRYVTVIAVPVVTFPATTTRIIRGNLVTINTSLSSISCRYSVNNGIDWTAILVTSGTSTTFLLEDSTYEVNAIHVQCTDQDGNVNTIKNTLQIIINMVGPIGLAVTFPSSTTPANLDISANIVITNLPSDAVSWSYSVDGSLNWTSKTIAATSFSLAEKLTAYTINSIRVRCEDTIGNYSAVITNPTPITIDLTGPYGMTVSFPSSTSLTYKIKTVSIGILPGDADSWSYSLDSGITWTIMATSALSFSLDDRTYNANAIQVKCVDQAGNYSASIVNTSTIIIDFTGPYGLVVGFPSSTSLSNKLKTVTVTTLPSDAASWSYSLDSGNNWTTMTLSSLSFPLDDNSYVSAAIRVKCVDAVGNTSAVISNSELIVIDFTKPIGFGVSFPSSTSVSYKNKLVTITNLPTDAFSWQYTMDSGISWTTRSPFSSVLTFSLLDGIYAIDAIQVSCADAAGNESTLIQNTDEIIIYETIYGMEVAFPSSTTPQTVLQPGAGTVFITTLPANVVSYKFSLDFGNSWKIVMRDGDICSFCLLEKTYETGAIQVVCMDGIGNYSDPVTNLVVIAIDYKSEFTPTISTIHVPDEPVSISSLCTLDLADESVIGTTVDEQRRFTSLLVKSIFSGNTAQNQLILTQGSILPGFSTAIPKDLYLYSASNNIVNGQQTALSVKDLVSKDFYILLESGDSISLRTIHETVIISKTSNSFKIQSNAGTSFASVGDIYSFDGLNVTLGSIYGTLTPPKVNFILSALNSQISLSTSAMIPDYTPTIISDATISLDTSVSADILQNTFFFRTDQLITGDEAFVFYYVDTTKWPDMQSTINPKNGIVINGNYAQNDSVSKDFIRDLAKQLFGTYLGADLFTNEDSVVSDINTNCDEIANRICTLLANIDKQIGISDEMQNDTSGNKYLNDNFASNSNISRVFLDQLMTTAPSRFVDIKSNFKYNDTEDGFYRMPILGGDTISFKLTITPSTTQISAVPTGLSDLNPRTYTVILNVI